MIQLFNVSKKYPNQVYALRDVTLSIEKGEFVFLVGPSGAGKSTLLRLLFRQETPSSGQILVGGRSILRLGRREIPVLRRRMGVVFQDFRLLPDRTVWDNVAFALEVQECSSRDIRAKVPRVLEMVGLAGREKALPGELSGGEQQRVAIARAAVNSPQVLLADEPTGNLDRETAWGIMQLLQDISYRGTTVIMASHAWDIVNKLKRRVVALDRGQMVKDERSGLYGYEAR